MLRHILTQSGPGITTADKVTVYWLHQASRLVGRKAI